MNGSDNFDSRALRYTDAFGQRFMRPGTYHYAIMVAGTGRMCGELPYTIKVKEGGKDKHMKQASVDVVYRDGRHEPENNEIMIDVGDLVLWSCRQPSAPPFEIVGDQEFFSSTRLVNECGYAHAFAVAGDYHWTDGNGSDLSGVVRVRDPKCKSREHMAGWKKELAKGALVMISGSKAEPSELEILTGQTVYFAIVKTEGISITDRRFTDSYHGSGGTSGHGHKCRPKPYP